MANRITGTIDIRPSLISTPASAEDRLARDRRDDRLEQDADARRPTGPSRVDQVEQPAGDAALIGGRGGEERHGLHGIGGVPAASGQAADSEGRGRATAEQQVLGLAAPRGGPAGRASTRGSCTSSSAPNCSRVRSMSTPASRFHQWKPCRVAVGAVHLRHAQVAAEQVVEHQRRRPALPAGGVGRRPARDVGRVLADVDAPGGTERPARSARRLGRDGHVGNASALPR